MTATNSDRRIDADYVSDRLGGVAYNDGDEVVHASANDAPAAADCPWSATITAPDALYDTDGKWHASVYAYSSARGMHDLHASANVESKTDALAFVAEHVAELAADH